MKKENSNKKKNVFLNSINIKLGFYEYINDKDSLIYKLNICLLFFGGNVFVRMFQKKIIDKETLVEFRRIKRKENQNVWKSKGLIFFIYIIYNIKIRYF